MPHAPANAPAEFGYCNAISGRIVSPPSGMPPCQSAPGLESGQISFVASGSVTCGHRGRVDRGRFLQRSPWHRVHASPSTPLARRPSLRALPWRNAICVIAFIQGIEHSNKAGGWSRHWSDIVKLFGRVGVRQWLSQTASVRRHNSRIEGLLRQVRCRKTAKRAVSIPGYGEQACGAKPAERNCRHAAVNDLDRCPILSPSSISVTIFGCRSRQRRGEISTAIVEPSAQVTLMISAMLALLHHILRPLITNSFRLRPPAL